MKRRKRIVRKSIDVRLHEKKMELVRATMAIEGIDWRTASRKVEMEHSLRMLPS